MDVVNEYDGSGGKRPLSSEVERALAKAHCVTGWRTAWMTLERIARGEKIPQHTLLGLISEFRRREEECWTHGPEGSHNLEGPDA